MAYTSDMNDKWSLIKDHFNTGNYGKRELTNAAIIKTCCQWRFLPKEYPPWKTVYSFYMRAKMSGIWV